MPEPDELLPMGIDADSGGPAVPPVTPETLAEWIMGSFGGARQPWASRAAKDAGERFGLADGINPDNLADCGYGVIWAPDVPADVRAALAPLLNRRRGEAIATKAERFREIEFQVKESVPEPVHAFLERHGVSPGIGEPDKLPYYLFIVGSPETIPFEFQYGLASDYAVGRMHLADAAACGRYAAAVLLAEDTKLHQPRAGLFGTAHAGDAATTASAAQLIAPMEPELKALPKWKIHPHAGAAATKDRLLRLLSGPDAAPVLFSATHGMEHTPNDARMATRQGSIICQDFTPGGPVKPAHIVTADDAAALGSLDHLVWFCFACFGAGTPAEDNFPGNPDLLTVRPLTPKPFQAALPAQLLGHAPGPALGFIGHVERAWASSFIFGTATHQYKDFAECLKRIMLGRRLGHAARVFGERSASLSAMLAVEMIRALRQRQKLDRRASWLIARLWTAAMDARNFVLLGDPAARRRIA
ncbi:MAG: hypothetical protein ACKV19_15695 [Verrucomicrobiales bacterium]